MEASSFRLSGLCCAVLLSTSANAIDPVIVVEGARLGDSTRSINEYSDIKLSPSSDGAELLRSVPGISGVRMGGHGIDPIIRGQSQNRLNILIDGAYLHGGCPNRMDPPTAYTATDAFDEVTIIKGSQTVIHGSGGPGGTVLFERITPRFMNDEGVRAHIAAGYRGNADTTELSADIATGNESGFIRGMASYMDANNYEDGDGNTVRSSFRNKEATLIGGYTPDNDTRVELSYQYNREDDILFPGARMDSPYTKNDTWRIEFSRKNIAALSNLKLEAYHSDVEHLMDNYSLRTSTTMNMSAPSTSDTLGGRALINFTSDNGWHWTVGADYQENDRYAERFRGPAGTADPTILQAILWPGVELQQIGLFAETDVRLDEANRIKAGLRYDHVNASASRTNRTASVTGALTRSPATLYATYYAAGTDNDRDEDNLGGFVTLEHQLDKNGLFYATASRTVRTADASERYLASDHGMAAMRWVGNPHIDAEKHHQLELGYLRQQDNWDMTASVYYNKVSDYIIRDIARSQSGILLTDGTTIYRNVSARLYGLEAGGNIRLTDNWLLGGSLAYVHATNTSDNRPLAQTPPLEGTLNLDYHRDNWHAGIKLTAQDRQNRVEDDTTVDSGLDAQKTPGWGILDLYGQYEFNDDITVSAGINNLLDKTYAYHVNRADNFDPTVVQVNEPGREIWLRASMEF